MMNVDDDDECVILLKLLPNRLLAVLNSCCINKVFVILNCSVLKTIKVIAYICVAMQ